MGEYSKDKGVLRIADDVDRAQVASILFENGYAVRPVFVGASRRCGGAIRYEYRPDDAYESGGAEDEG